MHPRYSRANDAAVPDLDGAPLSTGRSFVNNLRRLDAACADGEPTCWLAQQPTALRAVPRGEVAVAALETSADWPTALAGSGRTEWAC